MTNANGVPILGQTKPKAGVGLVGVLIRDLDENGLYDPEQVIDAGNGQLGAIPGRRNIVTAEDLVEMMREMVREEIAAALTKG